MIVRVWAPDASSVELEIANDRLAMQRDDYGWWTADSPVAAPGVDYGFVLDGAEPALPDPRSPFQPTGIHGKSRIVDHSTFPWSDTHWSAPTLESAIIYELHVGTFSAEGTFDAAIEHLDHLVGLGITHVELMPIAEFSGDRGWGYDGVDLFAPHHAYGGPNGLKRLVNACHKHGLAVLIDVVYNHLGPAGNYLSRFGPYLTDRYKTPWGDAINFDDRDSDEVRRLFCDNTIMWMRDYHFDGARIDAVHAILDSSALHFLEQLADEVRALSQQLSRSLVLIAESDLNDPRIVKPVERGGYGLTAQWSDDFHHALHSVLTGENKGYYEDFGTLAHLAKALTEVWVYDGRYSSHRRRRHGRSAAGLSGNKFLGYAQTHDQVGNRAIGERTSHLMNVGRLKIASALVLTAPFIPMLFQGEEWAATTPFLYFTGHTEAELGRAVREGRSHEFAAFGWDPEEIPDPQAPETFLRSKLNWDELELGYHSEILEWHRDLIKLRARFPELSDGRMDSIEVKFDERARWFIIARGRVTIVCNLATTAQLVPLSFNGSFRIEMKSEDSNRIRLPDGIDLLPDSIAILASSHVG